MQTQIDQILSEVADSGSLYFQDDNFRVMD